MGSGWSESNSEEENMDNKATNLREGRKKLWNKEKSAGGASNDNINRHSNDNLNTPPAPSINDGQLVPYTNLRQPGSYMMMNDDSVGQLGNVFSTRRPRDLGAGLSSGLKSVFKGVGLGAAAVVAAPVVGVSQDGVGGFFKGLGAGVLMAAFLPLAGVTVGLTQVARGAFNTPEAIREKSAGKKWDKKNREWKENWYSLEEEVSEIAELAVVYDEQKKELSSSATSTTGKMGHGHQRHHGEVKDTLYYDVLGVAPDASQAEIRKSYYKLARDCHPDKNQNDPQAHAKFQSIGEAYQILGDEKRRQDYDMYGKDAANEVPLIDPGLFFTMLFGSEALNPFVGKLKMAMFVETVENLETPGKMTEAIMEFEQRKREVGLAVQLRDRIKKFVEGNEVQRNEWRQEMADVAKSLSHLTFGAAMVEAIGFTYGNYAAQFLGKLDTFLGLGGRYAKLRAQKREYGNFYKLAESAVKASLAAKKLIKLEEKRDKAAKVRGVKVTKPDDKKAAAQDAAHSPTAPMSQNFAQRGDSFLPNERKRKDAEFSEQMPSGKHPAGAAASSGNPATDEEFNEPTTTQEEQRAHAEGIKQMTETLPLVFQTMLAVCLLDIEATVRKAAKKVLKDLETPIEIRRQQAEALVELGGIFQHEAELFQQEHKDDPIDMMRHVEEAFIKAQQEADKEDHKDQ